MPLVKENRHCRITFQDGMVQTGVIYTSAESDTSRYQFVKTIDLIEFYQYRQQDDRVNMSRLCREVRADEIKKAEELQFNY